MAWTIEFDSGVEKDLKKLGRNTQKLILDYLENRLASSEDPRIFGKPLRYKLAGCWRYRVENYRIIAKIEDDRLVILVVKVGHRKNIYD